MGWRGLNSSLTSLLASTARLGAATPLEGVGSGVCPRRHLAIQRTSVVVANSSFDHVRASLASKRVD
jgi:hypothetical protein